MTTPKPKTQPREEKAPRAKRPGKKATQKLMAASLLGQPLAPEDQASLEAAFAPSRMDLQIRTALDALGKADPWERDRAWVSDALIQCPLPISKPTGEEKNKVIREAHTGSGTLTVIYAATGLQGVAYGSDAYLLDVLISEARKRGERVVTFDTAIQIMKLAGYDVGGQDYHRFREALERIGGLHITVMRRGIAKVNYRVVKVQNLDLPTQEDVRRELEGQRRMVQYAFEFSEEFYDDFMRFYSVIPQDLLDAYGGSPTEYAIARWVYRRATKAQMASCIPLDEIRQELVPSDSNPRRFRAKFEKVLLHMQMHWSDLQQAWKPKKERRNGSEVLVGIQIMKGIPPLIPDRTPAAIGQVGTV